ncbi:MAG: response regulator transcription factor [Ruminococcus sp.]|uniref:response regulator transcription factor n=1 Tax=Ruminococcus sp. TaxID=41978 RepID=UPI0025D51F6E|nr:response regulator transcription factor [Ruminococcus sp.]MCR5600115.1 response regulator transcription factor [Ruminococcus sp.]
MINIENSSILVVDDDHDIVNAIAALLSREGYKIYKAYNGLEAIDSLMQNDIQLILIDVMMPKLDGLSAMMKIRTTRNIPIIVLSAKSEDSDKILGLSMGADDYITKPYNPMELVARVQSNLRRYLTLGAAEGLKNDNVLRLGGLSLDRDGKQVSVDGLPVKLTATEYRITELLMENAGRIFSAEEIYSRVWNDESYSVENTVMVHIRHIREKIEINPSDPRYLKVVWGIGYKMEKQ